MRTFVASDDKVLAAKIREVLLRNALDCPAQHVGPLDVAVDRSVRVRPDLLLVALTPNSDRALAVLAGVKGATHAHLVAVGPADDAKSVLQTLRAGAHEYLDVGDLDLELTSAIGRLRAAKSPDGEPGRVIAVLAPSGGSGASTLAANVATVLAERYRTAALVDLKLNTGDLAALLDLKPVHTLADLCRNLSRLDRSMFEQLLVVHGSGVHLLPAPQHYADVSHVTPQGVRQALIMARALFPFVIVDVDGGFDAQQSEALAQADVVLLVMRLDFTSLRNTRRALDRLEQMGVSEDRVRLIVNRYRQPKELPLRKARDVLGLTLLHCVPDDPRSVNRANNKGIPVVLERPRANVSRSIADLAMSVNGLDPSRRGIASVRT